MTIPIRKNTAQIITVGPFLDKTDRASPELSLTVTGCHITLVADTADGSAPTLVIDADATASGGDNDLVHITNDNAGYYSLELTAAQTNRNGHGRLCINDDDVHCPVFHDLVFLDANVFDSLYGTDKLNVDMVEISGDSTAADNLEAACDGGTYNVGGGAVVAASVTTKTGYELTAAYDAAKTAAQAGDKMDIVDSPSTTGKNAIVDAFLTRDFSSVSYTGTVKCVLTSLQKLRNTVQVVTGKLNIYKENGTDLSWEQTITEDSDANPVTKLES